MRYNATAEEVKGCETAARRNIERTFMARQTEGFAESHEDQVLPCGSPSKENNTVTQRPHPFRYLGLPAMNFGLLLVCWFFFPTV